MVAPQQVDDERNVIAQMGKKGRSEGWKKSILFYTIVNFFFSFVIPFLFSTTGRMTKSEVSNATRVLEKVQRL